MWCGKILSKSLPHVRESGLWNPGNFCLWNLELSRILLVESGIQNTAQAIQNPTNDWNPVPVAKTGVQYLESGIHGVESAIQDYRGFPYTERKSYNIDEKRPKPQYPIIHCIVLCITTSYHSSRFILYMKGAFCALNRLLLFLKQKFSFMWLQRLTQRSNNAFTVLITASESQCGNFYPFKNRYW